MKNESKLPLAILGTILLTLSGWTLKKTHDLEIRTSNIEQDLLFTKNILKRLIAHEVPFQNP